MPITSRISPTGLLSTTGQIDEASYNPASTFRKNLISFTTQLNNISYWTGFCGRGLAGYNGDTTNFAYNVTEVAAPDGTFTATRFFTGEVPTCGTGTSWGLLTTVSRIFIPGTTYTASVWARTLVGTATLAVGGNDYYMGYYPITTEWRRITHTFTPSGSPLINLDRGIQFFCTDKNVTVYVWGPQTEIGSQATIYVPTGANRVPLVTRIVNRTDANGNFFLAGIIDESSYNPSLNFTKNLLSITQNMPGAVWGQFNCTFLANNAIAPDGTKTAGKLLDSTTNSQHLYYQTRIGNSETVTWSIYAKAGERTTIGVYLTNFVNATAGAFFDLINGTISNISNTAIDYTNPIANIVNVGNGWYRCSITATKGTFNTSNNVQVLPIFNGNSSYVGDGVSGFYIWGPQLEYGTVATPYVATGPSARPLLTNVIRRIEPQGDNYVTSNYDEVTYNPTSGFLLNLLSYSNQFTVFGGGANALWTPTDTNRTPVFQTNAGIAPDGTNSATLVSASTSPTATSDANSFYQQNGITPSTNINYCISIFVKRNRSNITTIYNFFVTPVVKGSGLSYNFLTDTVTPFAADGGGITPTIFGRIRYPNDWVRLYYVVNDANSGQTTNLQVRFYPGDRNVLRNDDSTFYWGAQIEIGTFPSDYVNTGINRIPLI